MPSNKLPEELQQVANYCKASALIYIAKPGEFYCPVGCAFGGSGRLDPIPNDTLYCETLAMNLGCKNLKTCFEYTWQKKKELEKNGVDTNGK